MGALIIIRPMPTGCDAMVGDGNRGTAMEQGTREALQWLGLGALRLDRLSWPFFDLSNAVSALMGGTSGMLLKIFFCKAGTSLLALSLLSAVGGGKGRHTWVDLVHRHSRRLLGGHVCRVLLRRHAGWITDDA
jgi:hypothetical protein